MKKATILSAATIAMLTVAISCNQGPKFPSDEDMNQKVTDKYGAELENLRELRKMECETTMSDKINEKLNAAK